MMNCADALRANHVLRALHRIRERELTQRRELRSSKLTDILGEGRGRVGAVGEGRGRVGAVGVRPRAGRTVEVNLDRPSLRHPHLVHGEGRGLSLQGLTNHGKGGESGAPLALRLARVEFEGALVRGAHDAAVVAHLRAEERGLALHRQAEVGALVAHGVDVVHELLDEDLAAAELHYDSAARLLQVRGGDPG